MYKTNFSKSAKLNWGLSHAALRPIYTGGILPLLLYGAPVWINGTKKACYKQKIIRVQRKMNIKIAKAYRTVSNEALCLSTGVIPVDIKIEETTQLYQLTRGTRRAEVRFDQDMEVKNLLQPGIGIPIDRETVHSTMQVFTDGSKLD
jgi:hypothetical protein